MLRQIRTKILILILSTALGAVIVLSIIGMVSLLGMRRLTLRHGDQLGSTAARQSQTAMEAQGRNQLLTLARDRAALTDEKFSAIQNQTRMTADIATQIYTHRDRYGPVPIDYLQPGQAGELIPHLATAAGVSLAQRRDEIYRAANIGDILRQATALDIGLDSSYIGTESGFSIIVEKDAPPLEKEYDARTRFWYQGAKARGDLYWTDIYADVSGKGASISCAMPFYDLSNGGKVFKGVAASGMLLSETVNTIIDTTRIGETGYAFLLNEKGHMIISPQRGAISVSETGVLIGEDYRNHRDPAVRELAERMLNRESGLMELELYGQAVYVAYHPLDSITWSLGVAAAIDEIVAPARLIQQEILTLTQEAGSGINRNILLIVFGVTAVDIIAGAVMILLAIRFSNSITAPILSLSEGATIISSGDFTHQFEVTTGDEIEMLSDTFNGMTKKLIQAREEALRATKNKSDFLAKMSHEIRTPLNAILGLSEMELQNDLPEGTLMNLEKIYGSGFHLLEIINDILDISKIESGNFDILPGEYEFPGMISDTVQLNIIRIGSKPVKLVLALDETIPAKLYGDELRIKQILHNLLSNAIKYTEKGQICLIVGCEYREDRVWLNISVEDSGRGIKKEDMERLFSEYTQFDTTANRRIEGTGLGLSITRGLVNLMGGTITAESEYGKGSIFRVSLPQGIVDRTPIGTDMAEKLCNFHFIEARSRGRGNTIIRSYMPYGRVLVVDDLQTNLDVMTGFLTPYGLAVETALSGREAVERIRAGEGRYNLVFMDHMMPDMDGIEAARIIRNEIDTEYAKTVPIIVLTANAIAGNRELFLKSGFNDYISKPIDIKLLDVALNQWIRDKQSEETLKDAGDQARKRMESPGQESGSPGAEDRWLPEHPVEGIDLAAALLLYGEDAFFSILSSFVAHTPVLLEKMTAHLESSAPDYTTEIHGLKGACNAICASGVAALAQELEFAAREGNFDLARSRHGALIRETRKLLEALKALLEEWKAKRPAGEKERRTEPDRELLERLSHAAEGFDSGQIDAILEELERYEYERGEDLIRDLREEAENFNYSGILRLLAN